MVILYGILILLVFMVLTVLAMRQVYLIVLYIWSHLVKSYSTCSQNDAGVICQGKDYWFALLRENFMALINFVILHLVTEFYGTN